jgi:histone H3/H4
MLTMDLMPSHMADSIRFQRSAVEALQHGAEFFLSDVFTMAQLAALHARRQTVMLQDMQLVYEMHTLGSGKVMQTMKDGMRQYHEELP